MDPILEKVRANKKSSRFQQGYYTPRNPNKYIGDSSKIYYMSSWELAAYKFFDNNTNVIKWSSEELPIPYVKPTDGRIHKYYVDFWVQYKSANGEIHTEIIELKPKSQTTAPRKNSKHYLYQQLQYAVNIAKWQAAADFAKQRGWKFRIISENTLFK